MQPGILAPVPAHARFLTFHLTGDPTTVRSLPWGPDLVVGIGDSLARQLGLSIPGLRPFPSLESSVAIPATPGAIWIRVTGADPGAIFLRSREVIAALSGFELVDAVDGFFHAGRDLSGYEDGTENPVDDAAVAAAISKVPGIEGGSFAAIQRWKHDFSAFERMTEAERDDMIGRRRTDNEELPDAPDSAHVKRTAQESFDPEAFVVRRSMPWSDVRGAGLVFVAFGATLDAFEAQLRRMAGLEDGVTDALFRFSRPQTGGYYYCPPVVDGRLAV